MGLCTLKPPTQIHGFQFVKVLAGKKEAFEPGTPRYKLADPAFVEHLDKGGNYGVVGDSEHLIIDADSDELAMIVRSQLPATFTVTSATKQKPHFYYKCNWTPRDIPLTDWTTEDPKIGNIGTVRGKGYVVGPFSQVAGRQYLIDNTVPVAEVTEQQVLDVLLPWMAEKTQTMDREEWKGDKNNLEFPITSIPGIRDGSQVHPIHGSSSGSKNLHVDSRKNLWYCFACGAGGDSLQLFAVVTRIIRCDQAGPGGLRGELFKKTKQLALKERFITRDQVREQKEKQEAEEPQPGEVAKQLLSEFRILTFKDTDEMFYYSDNPGVYHNGAESLVAQMVEAGLEHEELDGFATIHFVREVQGHIRRKTYYDRKGFDCDPNVLNLLNGLLNISSFEVKPHSPDYPSLIQLPVEFDAKADCPKIKQFIEQVTFPEDRDTLQEMVGCLLERRSLQISMLLNGRGGNGKGLFLRLVQRMLGTENICSRSLQELEKNRFAKADLYGKLANIYGDLPSTAMDSVGTFKILTGSDPITAEKKFMQPFTFTPYAKHLYSCNKIPKVPDEMEAFFRRWIIINFPNQFLGEKDNKNLYDELTVESELSGFLNWALKGLERLRRNKYLFSQSRSVDETRLAWVRGSDPVKSFVDDCCKIESSLTIKRDELFQAFVEYCTKNLLAPLARSTFFTGLGLVAPTTRMARLGPKGARYYAQEGLALKPENDDSETEKDEGQDKL